MNCNIDTYNLPVITEIEELNNMEVLISVNQVLFRVPLSEIIKKIKEVNNGLNI